MKLFMATRVVTLRKVIEADSAEHAYELMKDMDNKDFASYVIEHHVEEQ